MVRSHQVVPCKCPIGDREERLFGIAFSEPVGPRIRLKWLLQTPGQVRQLCDNIP
jgi:hypothetical protein